MFLEKSSESYNYKYTYPYKVYRACSFLKWSDSKNALKMRSLYSKYDFKNYLIMSFIF